ncbi:MAG: tRNA lysidine(34) synthetase TilS [Planctomycetes bacterium]|nr:tRNA lysidine(34) synthetase TilS [Planctomycetota bacterium]
MDARQLHKRLADATAESLPAGAAIVCAVSGGVDSVAMLHGLVAVNEIHERRWRLHVAHLDHGLREASGGDSRFVESLAKSLGLPYTQQSSDIRGEAKRARRGIEETARRIRYDFLECVACEIGAAHICVAHHADDQAETVLHRILRGTGIRGLAGMAAARPIREGSDIQLVRPVLSFCRRELQSYLETRGVDWRHDETNDDPDAATRNTIRHDLLPKLCDAVNPEAAAALIRLAEHARRCDEAIRQFALDALRHMHVDESPGSVRLAAASVAGLPTAVQSEIVTILLDRVAASRKEIGLERIDAVLALIGGGDHKRHIELPGGVAATRQGKWFTLACIATDNRAALESTRDSAHNPTPR